MCDPDCHSGMREKNSYAVFYYEYGTLWKQAD